MKKDPDVFTTGQVARICGFCQGTISRCFDAGRLKGYRKPGSRFRLIPRDNLEKFMREFKIPMDRLPPKDESSSVGKK